jgi:hypothetical protein
MSNIQAIASIPHDLPQANLNEVFQTKAVRFAFLTPDGSPGEFKPFMPSVKCRDFLNDVIQSKATGEDIEIYGLEIPYDENHLDKSVTRLLLQCPDLASRNKFVDNFEFILEKEFKYFNVSPSELFEVKENPNWLIIQADPYWQSATFLISLYTFLCRSSLYMERPDSDWFELQRLRGVDAGYMECLMKHSFDTVLPKLSEVGVEQSPTPSGFPSTDRYDIDFVHDSGGILSLFQLFKNQYSWDTDNRKASFYVAELDRLCA